MEDRIQKIIAAAGIASRRAAEELIVEGRVRVNGAVVTELGAKADAEKDHIKVDGKLINPKQPKTYLMLNKPAGCVTTMFDPEGRPTVTELLKGVRIRVYPVGRLDYDTEGLLLLTNDGDFAFRVTHPSHELPKTYHVKVKGVLEDRQIDSLEAGVFLKDGKTAPAKVKKLRKEESNSWIEITIHEGRKRQVRRMIDHTGHSVIKLKRVRIGNLSLGDLPLGSFRYLTHDEVQALQDMAQGGDGVRSGAEAKPSRRPAAAGHVPEFIEGPKLRARAPRKEAPRGAGTARFSRSAAGSERPRGPEVRERTFEKKAWQPEPRDRRPDRRSAVHDEKRFAKPAIAGGDRPFRSKGPRTEEGTGAGRGPARSFRSRPAYGEQSDRRPDRRSAVHDEKRFAKPAFAGGDRPFRSRGPRKEEGTGARRGQIRSSGSKPAYREQGDRRPMRREGGQDERRSGKPFFSGQDRPFRRPDAQQGRGPRPGGDRPFTVSRSRPQERGARPDAGARRPAGRSGWQRDDRARGPAPFGGDRGPRKARPAQGTSDRPRSRPGTGPRPSGAFPRGPKGPSRRRS